MVLEVSWDGLWRLSLGLPQFHGHGSWLVCEVAVRSRRKWKEAGDECFRPLRIKHALHPVVHSLDFISVFF
jgi:hypothetical protein